MKSSIRKTITILLTMALVFSYMPSLAFAQEGELADDVGDKPQVEEPQQEVEEPAVVEESNESQNSLEDDEEEVIDVIKTKAKENINSFKKLNVELPTITEGTRESSPSIKVIKEDLDSRPIKDAEFKLTKVGGDSITGVTDAQGFLTFSLSLGSYKLEEVSAPDGYIKSDKVYNIEVYEDINGRTRVTVDGELAESILVQNAYAGDLIIQKEGSGNGVDPDKEFKIKINTRNLNGTFDFIGFNKPNGTITFTDGVAEIYLKVGQNIRIKNLPAGLAYAIQEDDYSDEGYSSSSTGERGTITFNSDKIATFTNSKIVGDLKVEKNLEGNSNETSKEFHFTLNLVGTEAVLPFSGTVDYEGTGGKADGSLTFVDGNAEFILMDGEGIIIHGLPHDWHYTVTEDDYTSDYFTTTMTGDDGVINGREMQTASFVNEKWVGMLKIMKIVEGNAADADMEFEFTVMVEDFNGQVEYMGYGGKDDGMLTFVDGEAHIKLMAGEAVTIMGLPNGLNYEVVENDYTDEGYVLTKMGDMGVIDFEIKKIATFTNTKDIPENTNINTTETTSTNVPMTGDDMGLLNWMILLIIALAVVSVVVVYKRKRNRS